ncbi:MAG TPA: hypothetical protein VK524_30000, partial [Polyangiaceae bacterium]|nr:hypothetical protein [Polyangiaceae bacterium]
MKHALSSSIRDIGVLGVACMAVSCEPEQTLHVTNVEDGGSGSLRAAIATLNADPESHYRIELPPGAIDLTLCGRDDSNAAGDLDLTSLGRVTIVGAGTIIQQRCAGERVLDARSPSLTLANVGITGGTLTGTGTLMGGGVRADGDVTLVQAQITNNAVTATPAECDDRTSCDRAAYGGGLYVGGNFSATRSEIYGNSARGADSVRTPDASQPEPAGGAYGGGVYVVGSLTIQGGAVGGNRAIGGKGATGFASTGGGSKGGDAHGGGVAQPLDGAALVQLQGVDVSYNTAQAGSSADDVITETGAVLGSGGAARGGALA